MAYLHRHDDNLPEVVPDTAPQALSAAQAYDRRYIDEGDPKFFVSESGTPKTGVADTPTTAFVSSASPGTYSAPWSPEKETVRTEDVADAPARPQEHRMCGLTRRAFFLALIALLVIIAAAVGGGVGGAEAAKKRAEADAAAAAATTTSSSTTTPSSTSTTSSASATPTFLNNSTGPDRDFQFQGFSDNGYGGDSTPVLRKTGHVKLPFAAKSYVWLPNGTDCCVTFCSNQTEEGWGGWRCAEFHQEKASGPFSFLYFGCGADSQENHTKCEGET